MKTTTLLIVLISVFFAKGQNINISNGTVFDGEPYIVIDPQNPQHLVAAWMGFEVGKKITINTSYSNNGGLTWSTPIHFDHQVVDNSSADVSLGYDQSGNLFATYIDYDNVNFLNGAVYTRKSIDGGMSWGPAVEAISILDCPNKLCVDRPWMVIDRSGGPNDGTIYITSMNADQPTIVTAPYNPYIVVSNDHAASFSTPRYLDTLNFLSGSTIKQAYPTGTVSANGTFYALYPSYEPVNQGPFAHYYLAKSTSLGVNIDHSSAYKATGGSVTNQLAKKGSILKSNPSDANHLAYFFLAQLNSDADVYMIETYNGGNTWTTPIRINKDAINNGKLQDLVWADFDNDGDLVVTWRDRRNAPGNDYQQPTEIYASIRRKGSSIFEPEFTLTSNAIPHHSTLEGKGNDFMCVEFNEDTIYAVWGDVRSGSLNIYLNKYDATNGTASLIKIASQDLPKLSIYPNPTNDLIYMYSEEKIDYFEVIDALGKVYFQGNNFPEKGLDVSNLIKGTYLVKVNKGKIKQQVVFVKN